MADSDEVKVLAQELFAAAEELNWNTWSFDLTAWKALARQVVKARG